MFDDDLGGLLLGIDGLIAVFVLAAGLLIGILHGICRTKLKRLERRADRLVRAEFVPITQLTPYEAAMLHPEGKHGATAELLAMAQQGVVRINEIGPQQGFRIERLGTPSTEPARLVLEALETAAVERGESAWSWRAGEEPDKSDKRRWKKVRSRVRSRLISRGLISRMQPLCRGLAWIVLALWLAGTVLAIPAFVLVIGGDAGGMSADRLRDFVGMATLAGAGAGNAFRVRGGSPWLTKKGQATAWQLELLGRELEKYARPQVPGGHAVAAAAPQAPAWTLPYGVVVTDVSRLIGVAGVAGLIIAAPAAQSGQYTIGEFFSTLMEFVDTSAEFTDGDADGGSGDDGDGDGDGGDGGGD